MVCTWLCKGSNSVWCGCVRGQTVCGVVVLGVKQCVVWLCEGSNMQCAVWFTAAHLLYTDTNLTHQSLLSWSIGSHSQFAHLICLVDLAIVCTEAAM